MNEEKATIIVQKLVPKLFVNKRYDSDNTVKLGKEFKRLLEQGPNLDIFKDIMHNKFETLVTAIQPPLTLSKTKAAAVALLLGADCKSVMTCLQEAETLGYKNLEGAENWLQDFDIFPSWDLVWKEIQMEEEPEPEPEVAQELQEILTNVFAVEPNLEIKELEPEQEVKEVNVSANPNDRDTAQWHLLVDQLQTVQSNRKRLKEIAEALPNLQLNVNLIPRWQRMQDLDPNSEAAARGLAQGEYARQIINQFQTESVQLQTQINELDAKFPLDISASVRYGIPDFPGQVGITKTISYLEWRRDISELMDLQQLVNQGQANRADKIKLPYRSQLLVNRVVETDPGTELDKYVKAAKELQSRGPWG